MPERVDPVLSERIPDDLSVDFGAPAPGSSNPMPPEVVREYEERLHFVDVEPDIPKPHIYRHNGRWWVSIDRHSALGDGGFWTFEKARRRARQEWIDAGGCV